MNELAGGSVAFITGGVGTIVFLNAKFIMKALRLALTNMRTKQADLGIWC